MRDFFDKVQQQMAGELPFVIYNKPNNNRVVGFFQNDNRLYFADDFNEPGFVFAPFNGNQVVLIPKSRSEIIAIDWIREEANPTQLFYENHDGRADFENLVGKGIRAIENGQFQKVVLSRKEKVVVEHFDVVATFKNLVNTYPAAFTYGFYHPRIGMWFGASPEQLLKVSLGQFETMALAGTQKFDGNENVTWENKEKEEQQFVTDFILENLENVTSNIAFSNPYTYKAGNLLHLKTDISGTLDESSNVKHLLEILHPTPAVCGLPKDAAREFILEHEGYDRKYYSGYLGELHADVDADENTTDLFVNLRCMEIEHHSADLYIGCGVTKDSIPQKEFIETINKAMTIKKILI